MDVPSEWFSLIRYLFCECGKTFQDEQTFKEHLEKEQHVKMKEIDEYQCNKCTRVKFSKSSFGDHLIHSHMYCKWMQAEPSNLDYECTECDIKFNSASLLQYHQLIHERRKKRIQPKIHECHLCGKSYVSPFSVRLHMRSHTGERPFQCPLCPNAYMSRAQLGQHHLVHTGVKPYPCSMCDKTFRLSSARINHMLGVHLKRPVRKKRRRARAPLAEACNVVDSNDAVIPDSEDVTCEDGGHVGSMKLIHKYLK